MREPHNATNNMGITRVYDSLKNYIEVGLNGKNNKKRTMYIYKRKRYFVEVQKDTKIT